MSNKQLANSIASDIVTAIKREQIKERLEELRTELRAERISYSELAELQALAPHIAVGDVELEEPAGIPEFDGVHATASELFVCTNCNRLLRDEVTQ